MDFMTALEKVGVIAVIRDIDPDTAVDIVAALLSGGIHGVELALKAEHCVEAITRCVDRFGDQAIIGAGTVLDREHLAGASEAGANFIATPHCDPELASLATVRGVPLIMGALTPTEVITAVRTGTTAIKLFPGSSVGPSHLRALRQPFPQVAMIPTGGVTLQSMQSWFEAGALAVGMGGNLATGTPDQVAAKARAVQAEVRRIRGYCYLPQADDES